MSILCQYTTLKSRKNDFLCDVFFIGTTHSSVVHGPMGTQTFCSGDDSLSRVWFITTHCKYICCIRIIVKIRQRLGIVRVDLAENFGTNTSPRYERAGTGMDSDRRTAGITATSGREVASRDWRVAGRECPTSSSGLRTSLRCWFVEESVRSSKAANLRLS